MYKDSQTIHNNTSDKSPLGKTHKKNNKQNDRQTDKQNNNQKQNENGKQKGLNTPYDSAFKSIIRKCPRMALFLINEMFYQQDLIKEAYSGSEEITLLDKEFPSLEFGGLELDQRLMIHKDDADRIFHLECQSGQDGTLVLRLIQYDTRAALEDADYTISSVCVRLDDSGIVFLRSTRNTPVVMTVTLEVPQGGSVSYRIPVIKMKDYTLDVILEKKLFVLLPFLFFNYERELRKVPQKKRVYEEIQDLYRSVIGRLRELERRELITAYEGRTLYDALRTVFEALGRTNQADEEVRRIMGGEILEFSADKLYNEGQKVGFSNGEKVGFSNGEKAGDRRRLIDNLKIVMDKLGCDKDGAMDFLNVDQSERGDLRNAL